MVLLLDDLQWADEASLELLSFLVRAAVAEPVLVVGAYRDTEAPRGLFDLGTSAVRVPLAGLTRADVEELLADLPGPHADAGLAVRVWERSGGNPFFVRELSRLLQATDAGQSTPHLPAEVVETVRRRLARLPTDCVRLLEWAAVAGREIDISLLTACASDAELRRSPSTSPSPPRRAWSSTLDRPRFTHDLHREALLDGLAPGIAGASASGHRPSTCVPSAVGALRSGRGTPGRPRAPTRGPRPSTASVLAAREATHRLGHDDACRHLERALALLGTTSRSVRRLLLELAAAQDRAGRRDPARTSLREVASVARERGRRAVARPRRPRSAVPRRALGQPGRRGARPP